MSGQQFFDGAELTVVEIGHVLVHVEAVNWRANTMKKSGIEVIDRAIFYMGVLTGLKMSTCVSKKHKGPV
jgi:hypothetical protein